MAVEEASDRGIDIWRNYMAANARLKDRKPHLLFLTWDCKWEETMASTLPYLLKLIEPPRDKTNKMACAPSEDSDQPGHPPSLIRVFAARMKKAWVLSYPLSAQRRL